MEDGAYGSVDFVEDDSLVNEAHVEYDSRVFRKTKTCALENARGSGSGVGIFVSVSLSHLVFTRLCPDFSVLVMGSGSEAFRRVEDYCGEDSRLFAQVGGPQDGEDVYHCV